MSRPIDADALTKRLIEFCNKNCPYTAKERNVMCGSCFMGLALEAVEDAPTIEPQRKTDEWCTDCREYDQEKHCCPRFNRVIRQTLSEQTEWNNHTVACLLAELFGDACACNYNGIDEWLPEKCEVIDACPNPVGVACWEQFLKHRAERREHDTPH